MLDNLTHFEFLTVAGALVCGWIKFQNDYGKLSSRVHALETDNAEFKADVKQLLKDCLLYTSPSPRDQRGSGMPASA